MKERMRVYETHNPVFQVITTIECDCESILHKQFINKWHRGEWFKLGEGDIEYILANKDLLIKMTSSDFGVKDKIKHTKKDWKQYYKQIRQEARDKETSEQ